MKQWFMGILAVLIKEIHEVRRQPRMLFSLIAGPLLVLALFGATFRSANPVLRTVLVWPEKGIPGVDRGAVEGIVRANFQLVDVLSDEEEALRLLSEGEVDVVQIVPGTIQIIGSNRPQLQIISRTISPNVEPWLNWLTHLETSQINRQILFAQTIETQNEASRILDRTDQLEERLNQYLDEQPGEQEDEIVQRNRSLQNALKLLVAMIPVTGGVNGLADAQDPEVRDVVITLLDEVSRLDQDINQDPSLSREERVRRILQEIITLRDRLETYINLSPEEIVSPVQPAYKNLRGDPYSMMVYYTPGVLALLLQHLAVTLGALGLVRERLRGVFEMYQVTPINAVQVLLGKTLAYSFYVLVAGTALALLLYLLGVPFLSPIPQLVLLAVLLSLASVGIGLLISIVSPSDSQAVQLTMIMLLLSFFFSGFFMPLSSFSQFAQPLSAIIPMTHGLEGFQTMMLVGRQPGIQVWTSLVLIILVTYGLLSFGLWRMWKRGLP